MPATKPATNEIAPFRGAVITSFGVGWTGLPDRVQFLAYGDETCPTTGREHKQAFAYAKKAMRLTGWKKIFPGDHIEQMRGSFMHNEAYCSKEGSYHKFGEPPMADGLHYGMELVKRRAEVLAAGETAMDIAEDPECFSEVMRCTNSIEKYIAHHRGKKIRRDFTPPEVVYIHGPAGAGKTRYVYEHEEYPFRVPDVHGSWRDGYAMDEAVMYNNIESGLIKNRATFLEEIDRYPIQVPVKGAYTWWKPRRIYITALQTPEEFAQAFQHPDEFHRRVTKVIKLPSI